MLLQPRETAVSYIRTHTIVFPPTSNFRLRSAWPYVQTLTFSSGITVYIHRIFSSAQQSGSTSAVVAHSKLPLLNLATGKELPTRPQAGAVLCRQFYGAHGSFPTFQARINVASSNASIASSTVLQCYFGLGELEITVEERFRSPTVTDWDELEATALN